VSGWAQKVSTALQVDPFNESAVASLIASKE
jgi:hypothetical protein